MPSKPGVSSLSAVRHRTQHGFEQHNRPRTGGNGFLFADDPTIAGGLCFCPRVACAVRFPCGIRQYCGLPSPALPPSHSPTQQIVPARTPRRTYGRPARQGRQTPRKAFCWSFGGWTRKVQRGLAQSKGFEARLEIAGPIRRATKRICLWASHGSIPSAYDEGHPLSSGAGGTVTLRPPVMRSLLVNGHRRSSPSAADSPSLRCTQFSCFLRPLTRG